MTTDQTVQLRAEIERRTGGRVSVAPEVIVGRGKCRATLRGGEPMLRSVTIRGGPEDALHALLESVIAEPGIPSR